MKKAILCAVCIGSACLANAQSLQKYLQIHTGGYYADMEIKGEPLYSIQPVPKPDYSDPYRPGAGFSAGLSGGFIWKRWKAETGVDYLSLTRSYNNLLVMEGPSPGTFVNVNVERSERYRQIIVPVSLGYNVLVPGKTWSVYPQLSAAISYNYEYRSRSQGAGVDDAWRNGDYLNTTLVKKSIWAGAGVEIGYKLNRNFQLIAKPEVNYMINSYLKLDNFRQHPLLAGVKAGIRYAF